MPFVQAKCPECGGMLAVDDSKEAAVCQFCGEAFIVQEAINYYNTYNTYNTDNRVTNNYNNGAVVNNLYENKSKDFVIEVGVLKEYHGESVDVFVPDTVKEIPETCFKNLNIESISICHDDVMIHDNFKTNSKLKNITISEDVDFDFSFIKPALHDSEMKIDRINVVPGKSHNSNDPLSMLLMFNISPDIIEIDDNCFKYKKVDGCIVNTKMKEIIRCDIKKTGVYTIPKEIIMIGYKAFCDCSLLTSVIMHDDIVSIFPFAFAGCSSLHSVEFPPKICEIGVATFKNCSGLTTLTIPKRILKLGEDAFRGCTGLKRLSIPGHLLSSIYTVKDSGIDMMFTGAKIEELEITESHSPATRDHYLGLTYDGNGIFSFFGLFPYSLKKVIISDNIEELEDYAFYNCYWIEKIELPDSLMKIGIEAFSRCKLLKSIVIPNNVTNIGKKAFSDCYDLERVNIPFGVTKIEEKTFRYCSDLKYITIPESVTEIGVEAFNYCKKLESIDIPFSVKKIHKKAFRCCYALKTVKIRNPHVEIDAECFTFASAIEVLEISENAVICPGAFREFWRIHNRCMACGGMFGFLGICKKCKNKLEIIECED